MGDERLLVPGAAEERVGLGVLALYLTLWAALTVGALFVWPDVVEPAPSFAPSSLVPLLVAYHLRRGSADAWRWGLAFHLLVSAAGSALAIVHSALNEVDPVLFAYTAGSWVVTAVIFRSRRDPVPITRGWAVFLGFVVLWSGWSGLQAAIEAREEFARKELLAPGPWTTSESPPDPPDMSFFAKGGEATLIAFGERNETSWAIYTYRARDEAVHCIGFAEREKLLWGNCPLDFVASDHLMSQSSSGEDSGNAVYGVVSRRVAGIELRLRDGEVRSVPIVVPPAGAGLDVNVYVAFLPDGVGPEEFELSAFDSEGERVDELGGIGFD